MMSEIDNVLQDFELLTEIAYDLSQKFDGVETQDIRKKKSTYFLAKVVPGCISLLKIIPKSSFSFNKDTHLDFSSISTLSRNLIEAANLHWYYCIDHIDEEEINFRFLLYDYHDTTTLYRVTESLKFSPEDIKYLGNQRSELRERLEKNSYFISLDKTEQKQIIKGRKSTLLTQIEITKKRNIDIDEFNGIYKLLSNHVHSTPASIESVVHSRIHGTEMDIVLTGLILNYSSCFLADMIRLIGNMWHMEFAKNESKDIVMEYSGNLICRT